MKSGGANHSQSDASETLSITTCEGLRLKTGVMYTDRTSKRVDTGQILSQARKGQWNAQKRV